MRKLRYHTVDVFTDRVFGGNSLAVFTNGLGISDGMMQALAKELNLSETTFVLPPDDPANDYHMRFFTPGKELPMAGHPTVGTSFILARERLINWSGSVTTICLEEGVGPIPVRIEFEADTPGMIWMTQPLPTFGEQLSDVGAIAAMLSLQAGDINTDLPMEVVSCGVPFLFVPVRSLKAVQGIRVRSDLFSRALQECAASEVFVFTQEVQHAGSTVHSRMFAPALGITEDPATGSASGPLGCYLVRHGLVPQEKAAHITSEQGIEMGRPSFIKIEIDQSDGEITGVRIGGQCKYMGEGYFELD